MALCGWNITQSFLLATTTFVGKMDTVNPGSGPTT